MSPVLLNQPFGQQLAWRFPVAYVETDLRGRMTFVNEAVCRMQAMKAEELLGREVWEFLPHDEVEHSRRELEAAIQSGEDPGIIRRPVFGRTGHFRNYEVHRRLLRDEAGRVAGICMALFDVSEAEHAHWEARQAQSWLECVVHAIPKAILVTDALGFVRYSNPAAEELTGRTGSEMTGQQIERCLPILRNHGHQQATPSFRMALHKPWSGFVDIGTGANQSRAVQLFASPMVDKETGDTSGVVILFSEAEMPAWEAE